MLCNVDDDDDDDDDAKVVELTRDAIDEFNQHVNKLLDSVQTKEVNLAQLLFVSINVNLDMYLRRVNDIEGAFYIAEKWVRRVARVSLPEEAHDFLDESFSGLCAALAFRVSNSSISEGFYQGFLLSKVLIHEWLESYFGGVVNEEYVIDKAKAWFANETAELLVDEKSPEALDALSSCFKFATTRGVLAEILTAYESAGDVVIPAGMFSLEEESLLKSALRSLNGKPTYRKVNHHKFKGCPKCYVSLIKDTITRLSTRRIAKCMECPTLLVSLEP